MKKMILCVFAAMLAFVPANAAALGYMGSDAALEDDIGESGELESESGAIAGNSIILRIKSPKAMVNGEIRHIDEGDGRIAPFIGENDRTLVPVRFIAEALGYGVGVDFGPEFKKIMIYENGDHGQNLRLEMFIGEKTLITGSGSAEMDAAPALTPEGRAFMPARAFAESLFMHIHYVESERIIIIADFDIGDAEEAAKNAAGYLPVWPLDMSKVQKEWKNWPENPDGTYHAGADFAIAEGSEVYCSYGGIVEDVAENASYGKYIVVKSLINGKTRYMYYAHLSSQSVEKGQIVAAGDAIGKSGNTGNSTGPHLHYEVRDENKNHGHPGNPSLNPYDYLP